MNLLNNNDVPIGFSMALAKDMDALSAFSSMNQEEKNSIINHSREIESKDEMQHYVSNLSNKFDS